MYLGDLARGRDNNLNLIRAVAATAVLVSHAWPIALGPGVAEPLSRATGRSLGTWSVEAFFVISGFLIAASFVRRPAAGPFLAARALRLFPGLFVSLLAVALVMGPLATTLPPAAYLADPALPEFLIRNMALASPLYTLPGVFETNPYPAVEGSIWTLGHEAACYLALLAAGLCGAFRSRGRLLGMLLGFALLWAGYAQAGQGLHPKLDALHRLALPFATGTFFFAVRDRMPLRLWIAAALWLPAVLLPVQPLQTLALAYSLFWLAHVPGGVLRSYNRLGDYSYGIYVYAFPIQGLAVWLAGPMGPGLNVALSLPPTVLCAVLSWHLVEAPALALLRRPAPAPRPPA